MLDAYIIERIRREKERSRKEPFVPLHIEEDDEARHMPAEEEAPEPPRPSRGSVIIDFQL